MKLSSLLKESYLTLNCFQYLHYDVRHAEGHQTVKDQRLLVIRNLSPGTWFGHVGKGGVSL